MRSGTLALLAAAAALLGGCAYTQSFLFSQYAELPRAPRQSVGVWDLGDDNCKGSLQSAGGDTYWVVDCRLKAGHGHCTHGIALVDRGGGKYSTSDGSVSFILGEDGRLAEFKDGKLLKRYAPLEGQICGARRE